MRVMIFFFLSRHMSSHEKKKDHAPFIRIGNTRRIQLRIQVLLYSKHSAYNANIARTGSRRVIFSRVVKKKSHRNNI